MKNDNRSSIFGQRIRDGSDRFWPSFSRASPHPPLDKIKNGPHRVPGYRVPAINPGSMAGQLQSRRAVGKNDKNVEIRVEQERKCLI